MRTTGIFRYVSANGASALAGRVGSKEITERRDRQCDIQVDHARLHHRTLILQINFEDAIHARESNYHAARAWNGAAAKTRTGSSAYNRQPVLPGDLDQRHYVFRRAREDHKIRQSLIHAAVIFIQLQFKRL